MSRMTIDNGDINSFIGNGQNLPKPPKKGEIMICQVCGQPMLPKDFSKNEKMRKREFKWHVHERCFLDVDRMIDQSVPGLLSERKQMEERNRR